MVERWQVPIAEAPDGVAILAPAEDGEELVQHYFDSRGVSRRYATEGRRRQPRLGARLRPDLPQARLVRSGA